MDLPGTKCYGDLCSYAVDGQCTYWTDDDGNIKSIPFPKWCESEELSN